MTRKQFNNVSCDLDLTNDLHFTIDFHFFFFEGGGGCCWRSCVWYFFLKLHSLSPVDIFVLLVHSMLVLTTQLFQLLWLIFILFSWLFEWYWNIQKMCPTFQRWNIGNSYYPRLSLNLLMTRLNKINMAFILGEVVLVNWYRPVVLLHTSGDYRDYTGSISYLASWWIIFRDTDFSS